MSYLSISRAKVTVPEIWSPGCTHDVASFKRPGLWLMDSRQNHKEKLLSGA